MNKGRILIIDDDTDILHAYKRVISRSGFLVETAENKAEGRKLAHQFRPDLILLDVVLGDDSGVELMKELRSHIKTSYVFIVLISGNVKSSEQRSEGLESGADGYLVKPVKPRELVAHIDSFMKHKRTIDKLKQSEQRFRKIVNRNVDGLLILDLNGKVNYANPSAGKLFDKDNAELLDMEFGYPVVSDESYEINVKTRHGFDRIAEMRTTRMNWNNQSMILASLRDVTERTRAEMRLQLQNEEIKRQNEDYKYLTEEYMVTNEELVESYDELRKANKDLEKAKNKLDDSFEKLNQANIVLEEKNRELDEARKIAEESNKLKSNFLASMAHELRSPLNTIIGFSDLINSGLSDEELEKYSQIIMNSGNNLLNIIDDTFNLALIDSGQVVVRKETFSLSDFFEQLNMSVEQLYVSVKKKGIEIEYVPDEGSPDITINSDRSKLQQVLMNLLKNAIKFTSKGIIKFGYKVEKTHLLFFVEDSGIGIPEDKKEVIFDRFKQVDDLTPKSTKGAGLGLAISKELVEILNGKIWVESEINKGSRFLFKIPYSPGEVAEPLKKEIKDTAYVEKCLKGKKILIVEDDETNYLLLKSILKPYTTDIFHAWNGKQALQMFTEIKDFDCVLMDLRLPYMSGFDATKEIRKLNQKIPVIAVTAFAFKNDLKEAIECGCNEVIIKPVRKKELLGKMMNCCLEKE